MAVLLGTLAVGKADPASAKVSDYCFDMTWTDVPITYWPVALGTETWTDPNGTSWQGVCWSTNPAFDHTPEISGGMIWNGVRPDGWTATYCWPNGNAIVKIDCRIERFTSYSEQTPPISSPGGTASGYVHVQGLTVNTPATGAEAPLPVLNTANTVSVGLLGPCLWVLGVQVLPGCTSSASEVHAEPGDAVPSPGLGWTTVCAGVGFNGTCLGTWTSVPNNVTVSFGDDPDQTVGGTVLGTGPGYDPGHNCVSLQPTPC